MIFLKSHKKNIDYVLNCLPSQETQCKTRQHILFSGKIDFLRLPGPKGRAVKFSCFPYFFATTSVKLEIPPAGRNDSDLRVEGSGR
jgi:hypothetical protein